MGAFTWLVGIIGVYMQYNGGIDLPLKEECGILYIV